VPKADFKRGVKVCQNKACQHGDVEQPLTNFGLNTARDDGLREICKDCAKIAHKARMAKLTPEQRKARNRRMKLKKQEKAKRELMQASHANMIQLAKKPDVTSVEMLSAQLMHASGGVEAYARKYVNAVDSCEKEGNKIRGYQGIASVVVAASKVSVEANKGPGQMSDEELQVRFNQLMEERERLISQREAIEVEYKPVV
jgi:hypothetical protein